MSNFMHKRWSRFLDGDVVHHLFELMKPQRVIRRVTWLAYFLFATGFCCAVVWNISFAMFRDESTTSVSMEDVDRFPSFDFCSPEISEEIVIAAGFDDCTANILRTMAVLGSEPIDQNELLGIRCNDTSLRSNSLTVQNVLRKIGNVQKERYGFEEASAKKFGMIPLETNVLPHLASHGYCIRVEFLQPMTLSATELQYLFGTIEIANTTAIDEHGGIFMSTADETYPYFPAKSLRLGTGLYYLYIKQTFKKKRKTRTSDCSSVDDDTVDSTNCFYDCLNKQPGCRGVCQIFNPAGSQLLSQLCANGRVEHAPCVEMMQSQKLDCSLKCNPRCKQRKYETVVSTLDGKIDTIWIDVKMTRVETAISIQEEKAVASLTYFGYLGGNLGLFFGLHLYGFLSAVVGDFSQFIFKYGGKRLKLMRKLSDTSLSNIHWLPAFFLLFAMAPQVVQQFQELKTSGTISNDGKMVMPELALCSSWLNESKMMEFFDHISPEFWVSDGAGWSEKNTTNPPLCTAIQMLMMTNPATLENIADITANQDDMAKKHRENVDTVGHAMQRRGVNIDELVRAISYDGSQLIRSISTSLGQAVPYTFSNFLSPMGVCYVVKMNFSSLTKASVNIGPIQIDLLPGPKDQFRCEASGPLSKGRKVIYLAESFEKVAKMDVLSLFKDQDMILTPRSEQAQLKSNPERMCQTSKEDSESNYRCTHRCVQRNTSCTACRFYSAGSEAVPPRNVTGLCSFFGPPSFFQNCFFQQLFSEAGLYSACNKECGHPCSRVMFDAEYTKKLTADLRHGHSLSLNLMEQASGFRVREFYAYNLVAMICTIGGFCGLLLGYSWITVSKVIFEDLLRVL